MSFFSRLAEIIGEQYSVQVTVQKKGTNLSVSIVPKTINAKDKAVKTIIPIVITGTPDQIDAGIISAIAQPVQSLNQLVVSGQAFTKEEKKTGTKKTETKKEEPKPKVEESKLDFDEKSEKPIDSPKPAIKGGDATVDTTGDAHIADKPVETLENNTGDELNPADLIDKPTEAEIKGAPALEETAVEEPADAGQADMFNDEDWA